MKLREATLILANGVKEEGFMDISLAVDKFVILYKEDNVKGELYLVPISGVEFIKIGEDNG